MQSEDVSIRDSADVHDDGSGNTSNALAAFAAPFAASSGAFPDPNSSKAQNRRHRRVSTTAFPRADLHSTVLVLLSDTHGTDGHRLEGRTREAVDGADLVIHAGDFTTASALDAHREAAGDLLAVHGNADDRAVRQRLPAARTVEALGLRVAVTHTRDGGATGLAMFGRSRAADVVVSGHSHRPSVTEADDLLLVNPGSHAQPRGNRPAHAELERSDGGVVGRLRQPDGTVFETFGIESED
jgi:putative phosphoesterase